MDVYSRLKHAAFEILKKSSITKEFIKEVGRFVLEEETKEIVYSDGKTVRRISSISMPIGSVVQSFLSQSDFQAINGKGWVLCHGQNVPNTRYAREKIGTKLGLGKADKLPDCQGKYLRTAKKGQKPATEQDQETGLNSLTAKVENRNVLHTLKATDGKSNLKFFRAKKEAPGACWTIRWNVTSTHSSFIAAEVKSDGFPTTPDVVENKNVYIDHRHDLYHATNDYNPKMMGNGTQNAILDVGHKHDVNGSIKLESDAIKLKGGSETRPDSILVNTFIRVD